MSSARAKLSSPGWARTACGLVLLKVTEELIGESAGVREREEMAACKLVDGDLQSLPCDATLKLDRKEPIVASGDHMDRDRGPRRESAGLAEHDVGLGALPRLASLDDLGRKIMQEVGSEIEVRVATNASLTRRCCSLSSSP